ncbi:TniB family NTP-binding protein [Cupriavidus sp. amp6]|uniref:TniB family NTP-binding protein n=1 Tax=Cupriavidus sp. amp6 TaxID=388051 RepID=UPI0006869CB3|nr:TniB family NTP-binding protein [Cupriavidus sp. amp6]
MLENLTTEQRDALIGFKRQTIMFPLFNSAYGGIKTALTLFRATGIVQNHLVLGQSGCGKSTLCRIICSEHPRFDEVERTVVPVLYVRVPPLATVSSLAEELLVKLGDPAPYKGKPKEKTDRLTGLIGKCGVQMIIIDELQHVHDRGQYPTIAKVADWIKDLEEAVSIPFIMAGLPRAEILLDANDQLRRRFSAALSLDRMVIDQDDVQAAAFVGVVAALLSAIRIRSEIDIDDINTIERIYYARLSTVTGKLLRRGCKL